MKGVDGLGHYSFHPLVDCCKLLVLLLYQQLLEIQLLSQSLDLLLRSVMVIHSSNQVFPQTRSLGLQCLQFGCSHDGLLLIGQVLGSNVHYLSQHLTTESLVITKISRDN